jgi:hypothetical protein
MRGSVVHDAAEPPGRAVLEADDQPHFVGRCRFPMQVAHARRQPRHPREGLVHRHLVEPLLAVVLLQLAPIGHRIPRGNRQNPLPRPRGSFSRGSLRKDVQDLLRKRHSIILEPKLTPCVSYLLGPTPRT